MTFVVVAVMVQVAFGLAYAASRWQAKPDVPPRLREPPPIPPWFERLEMALLHKGLEARVVVDRTPMRVHSLVRGVSSKASLSDALGPVSGSSTAFALAHLQRHGPIELVDGVLVTSLDRAAVDGWDDAGIALYAADVAAVATGIVRRAHALEAAKRAPAPADAAPDAPEGPVDGAKRADAAHDAAQDAVHDAVHDAEGPPSGAPIAISFTRGGER